MHPYWQIRRRHKVQRKCFILHEKLANAEKQINLNVVVSLISTKIFNPFILAKNKNK